MDECYALAIRTEDQQWYKEMMFRIKRDEAIARIRILCEQMTATFILVFDEVKNAIVEVWEETKPKLDELSAYINESLSLLNLEMEEEEEKEERKIWVSYNPPNENEWYNQYQRNMLRDQRSDMKHFTIYRRE